MGRKKKPKVRRYDADAPLTLAVSVPIEEPRPAGPRGWLSRPAAAVVRMLPSLPSGPGAATADKIWKLVLGVAGLALVTRASDGAWGWAVAGVLLGASTLWLPLTDIRRIRWTRWAEGLAAPRARRSWRAGELRWDGRKLVIRTDDRVWRSLRPASPPHEVVVGERAGAAWLGLIPAEGAKARSVWLRGPASELAAAPLAVEPPADPVGVDGEAWTALFEAFVCRVDRLPKAGD